jgi:hypothetical protein
MCARRRRVKEMSRTSYLRRPLAALVMGAALAASVVMAAVVLASPAWAATYTVTNNADSGAGSLRQAIIDANATTGVADTINFDLGSAATITLTSSLPPITDGAGLTIDGGSADITISGDNQYHVFEVGSGAKLTLSNLTVAHSTAFRGGGIHNSGTLEVSNSTLSGNSAPNGGGILNGGGATATLKNTIVAKSLSGGSCSGIITNGGYNLDSDNTCFFGTNNNSLSGVDPMLGPLADNGGPTKTHALLAGSPAIDKGNSFSATTDQRGLVRPSNFVDIVNAADGSDIGAFELQAPPTQPDTTPPKVISTFPGNGGEVGPAANIRATFSEDMRPASVKDAFKLFKKGSTNQIAAQVSYDAATDKATLNPNNNLRRGATYKAVVTTVAKDMAGNRLDQDSSTAGLQQKVWFFEID